MRGCAQRRRPPPARRPPPTPPPYPPSPQELGRKFVESVYEELLRVAEMCEPSGLGRFGELRERAVEVVQALLRRCYAPALEQVQLLIDIELAHINTLHPDFIGSDGAYRAVKYSCDLPAYDDAVEGPSEGAGGGGHRGAAHHPGGAPEEEDEPLDVPADVDWALGRIGGGGGGPAGRAGRGPRPAYAAGDVYAYGSDAAGGQEGSAGGPTPARARGARTAQRAAREARWGAEAEAPASAALLLQVSAGMRGCGGARAPPRAQRPRAPP